VYLKSGKFGSLACYFEKHGLGMFENRILRRMFGTKREGVVGGWRRLHNEELRNLYS
jgi:hypothetical protein